VTAAVARVATLADHPLLSGYVAHCRALRVSDRALRDRLRLARQFLARHPDLDAWMARPLDGRLADLRRIQAWSLISYAVLAGRVRIDIDLLVAKDLGGFGRTAEVMFAEDVAHARAACVQLGWSPRWTLDIVRECLPLVLAWCGRRMGELTAADLDAFAAALDATPAYSASSRKAYHARLHGLRGVLYECRILDVPPKRGRRGASVAERLAVVPSPEIRRVMVRYVEVRGAVLRPATITSLVEGLAIFGEFLGQRHHQVRSLRQLERGHVEAFLAWNATRPWRGRVARSRRAGPVAASVVHATVLTVRNFLDDLALWGWTERPARQLVFASDVPRLPRALPRALSPDQDRALMAAVAQLADPFCAAWGCGWASCSTWSWTASSTTARPEAGCGSRSASSAPSARCRLTPTPWSHWTPGPPTAAPSAPCRTPATADPPTSCSASTAGSCDPGASARGSTRPCTPPGSPARMGRRCGWCPTSCATPTARCWSTPG
jgi:hypothetical protein